MVATVAVTKSLNKHRREPLPAIAGFFRFVLSSEHLMPTTFDFQILVQTDKPGLSLVVAQNEDAFSYLTKEEEYAYLNDGSVPLVNEAIGDFISDAEHAHFCAALV